MNGIGQIGVLNDVAGSVHRRINKQSTSQANTRVYYMNFSAQSQSVSTASPTDIMADSNAETILMLTGISGCTDDEARRWLKVKNSDADAALNAILDNEDLTKAEVSNLFPTAEHCPTVAEECTEFMSTEWCLKTPSRNISMAELLIQKRTLHSCSLQYHYIST